MCCCGCANTQESMYRSRSNRDSGERGLGIPFREHSMLRNPKTPTEVVNSKIEVTICKVHTAYRSMHIHALLADLQGRLLPGGHWAPFLKCCSWSHNKVRGKFLGKLCTESSNVSCKANFLRNPSVQDSSIGSLSPCAISLSPSSITASGGVFLLPSFCC